MGSIDLPLVLSKFGIGKFDFDTPENENWMNINVVNFSDDFLKQILIHGKSVARVTSKPTEEIQVEDHDYLILAKKLSLEEIEHYFCNLGTFYEGIIFFSNQMDVLFFPGCKTSPQLSIVVPVYNMKLHIGKLLSDFESISNLNLEVIFVNDGSTDDSGDLIRCWIEEVEIPCSAKLINKSNGGCASARNLGLAEATAPYLIFVDSDDRVMTDAYAPALFLAYLHDADILRTIHYTFYEGSNDVVLRSDANLVNSPRCIPNVSPFDLALEEPGIWRNLYKSSFLSQNNLKFELIQRFDDIGFTIKAALLARKIVKTNILSYGYQLGRDGQDTAASDERLLVVLDIYQDLIEFMKQTEARQTIFRVIFLSKIGTYKWAYWKLDKSLRKNFSRVFIDDIRHDTSLSTLEKFYCSYLDFKSHGWSTLRWFSSMAYRNSLK